MWFRFNILLSFVLVLILNLDLVNAVPFQLSVYILIEEHGEACNVNKSLDLGDRRSKFELQSIYV